MAVRATRRLNVVARLVLEARSLAVEERLNAAHALNEDMKRAHYGLAVRLDAAADGLEAILMLDAYQGDPRRV
jgi:hypothetical protein